MVNDVNNLTDRQDDDSQCAGIVECLKVTDLPDSVLPVRTLPGMVLPRAVLERVVVAKEVEEKKNGDKDDRVASKHESTCTPLDLKFITHAHGAIQIHISSSLEPLAAAISRRRLHKP